MGAVSFFRLRRDFEEDFEEDFEDEEASLTANICSMMVWSWVA